jgi:hypothetical protein
MGIENIHILIDPEAQVDAGAMALAAIEQKLLDDHRQGKHTVGNMSRACPLCK